MNVLPAWRKGYTGKGVVISILDDGIQHNHPDLAQNYVSTMGFYCRIISMDSLIDVLTCNTVAWIYVRGCSV